MPTSDYHAVSDIMGEIQRLSPRSVLDLGVGFGKYGVLCREILDARFGRCQQEQWQADIVGYEAWTGYRNPVWAAYSRLYDGAYGFFDEKLAMAAKLLPGLQVVAFSYYDLVLMIDSLEHLEPSYGRKFLRSLVQNNRHVIVSVPNGKMEQGEVFGNPHEAHRWTFNGTEEFAEYDFNLIHQSVCTVVSIKGAYGTNEVR